MDTATQTAGAPAPGEVKKVTPSNARAVEIDLPQAGRQKFTALNGNKRGTTLIRRLGEGMTTLEPIGTRGAPGLSSCVGTSRRSIEAPGAG